MSFLKLSLFGLRRKVRCAALQEMALQTQDFRCNPKVWDGNSLTKLLTVNSLDFRCNPKVGDGKPLNFSATYTNPL